MLAIQGFSSLPASLKGVVLTLGNFDGVHIGHRALLHRVIELAKKAGRPSLVVTFDPHPSRILRPDQAVPRLYEADETYQEIKSLGIDHVLMIPFTRERSQQSARDFLSELQKFLTPKTVVVGHDFAFGHDREGSFATLETFGRECGWQVEKIGPVVQDGDVVSSTLLRRLLAAGEIDRVNHFLGRSYELKGVVAHGEGRGAGIGFATANLTTKVEIFPATGVYVTEFVVNGRRFSSVTNVGTKPTFHEAFALTVETHVLGVSEHFYDQTVYVRFLKRLRAELKFPSAHELIKQIEQDITETKKYFGL